MKYLFGSLICNIELIVDIDLGIFVVCFEYFLIDIKIKSLFFIFNNYFFFVLLS